MKTLIRFSNALQKFATAQYILPLLAVLVVVLGVMEFSPIGQRPLRSLNDGFGMLDMVKSGYTADQTYAMFAQLGEAGRTLYVRLLGLDYVFAVVFMVLQSLMITNLLRRANLQGAWGLLNLLPYLRSALDIVENCLLLALLFSYPAQLPVIVGLASRVTMAKWVVYSHIIVVLIGLGAYTSMKTANPKTILKLARKTA